MFKGLYDALKDIPRFILFLQIFIATICPGFLIVFLYKSNLFMGLDIIKLTLFSISLSLPVFLLNAIIYSLGYKINGTEDQYINTKSSQNNYIQVIIANSSIITIVQLYLSILISWMFKLYFHIFLYIQVLAFFVHLVVIIVYNIIYRGKLKQVHEASSNPAIQGSTKDN